METHNFVTGQNVTIHDFERVCRTCLSTVDLQPISHVFDLAYFPVEIALNKYTQVQFNPLDNLPKQICSNCVKNLNNSYSFLLNCDLVNTALKECLARHESNLKTIYLPNEIEYVNCQIKQEPAEFDLSELESKEPPVLAPPAKIEKLHTAVDIKEETPVISEDENNSENYDSDGEPIITSVSHSGRKTLKRKHESEGELDMKSDSEMENTTPSVEMTQAQMNSLNLLPKISQKRYEISYNHFMNWRKTNNISTSFSENILMAYFEELSAEKKPNSLWTLYSMLGSTLSIYNDVNINNYLKLKALLKRNSNGYQPKRSKTLTPEEINKFLYEAPDSIYLLTKVALVFGITGACRKGELCQLKIDDVTDQNSSVLVNIHDAKTKKARSFTITGEFYNIYKKYVRLRPLNVKGKRFFVQYLNQRCTRQPVGLNKFGNIPKKIATYLGLQNPELYTGHCFRRSSASVLVGASADSSTPAAEDGLA